MVLPALREENLAKIEEENDKNVMCCLAKSEREEKLKNFLKKMFLKQSKNCFKKPEIRSSIDRKTGLVNRTKQRLTQILKQNFD